MENISSKDFTIEEWRSIQKYSAAADEVAAKKGGINSDEWNMASLAETADIDRSEERRVGKECSS